MITVTSIEEDWRRENVGISGRSYSRKNNLVPRAFSSTIFKMIGSSLDDPPCSVAVLSCVADMSNTFRLIICVVVSTNENAL